MANLSKIKRDEMIAFLDELKKAHSDDASIRAFNMIENHLREKKYGLVWEEHSEEVDELLADNIPVLSADPERRLCKDATLPWNFIIEGDNLQALYLLEKTHRGKVDCIYIDPPYNSGATDWKYNNRYVGENDEYRHSKWLSMMKNRLLLAKHLLNPDNSVLIVTIDEKEYLRLGCLLEELFPTATIQMVSSVINRAGTGRKHEFSRTDEYLFFVRIGSASITLEKLGGNETPVVWDTLRRSGPSNTRSKTKRQFYPIFVNDTTKRIHSIGNPLPPDMSVSSVVAPEGCTAVFPIRDNGTEMMWGCVGEEFINRWNKGYIRVGKHTPNKPQKYVISYLTGGIISDIDNGKAYIKNYLEDGSVNAFYYGNKEIPPTTNWNKPSHDAQWYGSNLIKPILGPNRFTYPKSLYAVKDCLSYCTSVKENKNAIIVDFFAGSGTTMHAVNLLNAEDGGTRQCIMVTNNEISVEDERRFAIDNFGNEELVVWNNHPTQKNASFKINYSSKEFLDFKDYYGIAKFVTWPRTVCTIEGCDIDGNALPGNYGVEIDAYAADEDSYVVSKATGKPAKTVIYKKTKTQLYPTLERINKADGFMANVKFFKCDWIPRKPEDYLLSNALCLHIREMIELQNAIEVDNLKNCLILNKNDLKKTVLNPEIYSQIQNIWVNQNIIFNAEELRLLEAKRFKYIPREFFGQELKEAAE